MNNQNIICKYCHAENAAGTKFCIKCGKSLESTTPFTNNVSTSNVSESTNVANNAAVNSIEQSTPVTSSPIQQDSVQSVPVQPVPNPVVEQPVNNINPVVSNPVVEQPINNINATVNSQPTEKMDYFKYVLNTFLKPYKTFKSEEKRFESMKEASIFTFIIIGAVTILSLIKTMISAVRVTHFYSDTEWVWANLKDVPYLKVILLGFLGYTAVAYVISGIYHISSMVAKSKSTYSKLLAAVTSALIPLLLSMFLLGPILNMVSLIIGSAVMAIGSLYSAIILMVLINDLINIENKDVKIYFHLVSITIITIVCAIIISITAVGTSSLGSLSSLF